MLDYSPTKTQKLLGNPDKSANPTASSPARAGLAGEHCNLKTGLYPYFGNPHGSIPLMDSMGYRFGIHETVGN